jgi:hypothetical protein
MAREPKLFSWRRPVWPFTKKSGNVDLPADEQQRWGIAQAEHDEAALLVRFNESAREWAGHADLPIRLGFAVPLKRPNKGGMPDAAENAELLSIEDVICRYVSEKMVGLHVLTLTTGVMKEWVFYVARGADIATLHGDVRSEVASHDVQCMAVEERRWESYQNFVP